MWVVMLATLLSGAASAPTKVTAKAHAEAKRLSKVASNRYDVGDFHAALTSYVAAYAQEPVPELLFNLGQCQKQLGNHERAIFHFDAYLRNVPRSKHRVLVEALVSESQAVLEGQISQAPRTLVLASAPYVADMTGLNSPDGDAMPDHRRWWFWPTVGSALAVATTVAIIGIVVGVNRAALPPGAGR